ncbi:flavoprotein [Streptomyces sp. NPDC006700]|jgi:phosphopantothenoylcysteine synthetase/decarboxylase|uniref:flavoprotein n=1 Tax=Streptomyces sp. NPDC006700 TaxID=3154479 RepID=UPI0033EB2F26
MAESPVSAAPAPAFGSRRLLYVGTGSLGVMFMPMWSQWLRTSYPQLEVRTVITRSAEQFVTRTALTVFTGREILVDAWPDEPRPKALHVELAQWPDAVVIHPASFHFVSRLALGMADTPVLLALQCTQAPVAVAPALPPGGTDSPAYRRHIEALAERPNVVVIPPTTGRSVTTGRMEASVSAPLSEVLARTEQLRLRMLAQSGPEER